MIHITVRVKNTKAVYFQQEAQSKRVNVFVIQEWTAFVYSTFLSWFFHLPHLLLTIFIYFWNKISNNTQRENLQNWTFAAFKISFLVNISTKVHFTGKTHTFGLAILLLFSIFCVEIEMILSQGTKREYLCLQVFTYLSVLNSVDLSLLSIT